MRVAWASILAVLIAVMPALVHTCDRGCVPDGAAAPRADLTAPTAPAPDAADCPLHESPAAPGPPTPSPHRPAPCQHEAVTVTVDIVKSPSVSPAAPAVAAAQDWPSAWQPAHAPLLLLPRRVHARPPIGSSTVLRI